SEFGHFDIVVDAVDPLRRDHLDALVRADIGATVAENAAVAIDEDVELALEAALGFLEADGLGVADFGFERVVHGSHAALRHREHGHGLAADTSVVIAPDEAAAHGGHRPLGDAF